MWNHRGHTIVINRNSPKYSSENFKEIRINRNITNRLRTNEHIGSKKRYFCLKERLIMGNRENKAIAFAILKHNTYEQHYLVVFVER